MPIYLLKANDSDSVGYNSYDAMVICAENEEQARGIAQERGGDEIHEWTTQYRERKDVPFWTDAKYSSCVVLDEANYASGEVVISSYNAG